MALSGNFTGGTLVYSVANLTGYTGDTLLLRRSSDNATSGFTEAELRDGTALAWIGANDAFVVTIYGQNGAFDLTQSTAGSQTQIASSGAWIVTQNGLPGIRFNGAGDYASTDGDYGLTDAIYLINVQSVINSSSNMTLISHWSGLGNLRSWLIGYNSGRNRNISSANGTGTNDASFNTFTHSTVYIREDQIDLSEATASDRSKLWSNGTSQTQSSFAGTQSGNLYDSTTNIRLGNALNNAGGNIFFYGDWFLSVAFPDNKVADRADIYEEVRSIFFDTQVTPEQVATPAPTATIPTVSTTGVVTDVTPEQVATPAPTATTPTIALTYNITPEQVATPPPTATIPTIDTFTNTDLTAENVATPAPTVTTPTITTAGGQHVVSYGEFVSDLGREWRVEIYDGEASVPYPESETLTLRSNGFTLSYESPNDELIEGVKASKASITAVVNPTDSSTISLITNIAQAEEGRFYIIIKEYLDEQWQWYWWGQILTDLIKEPDKWPSEVEIEAIDGMGLMNDTNYNPSEGGLFTGRETFAEILVKAIERVKQGSDIRDTDNYMKLGNEWYNAAMPDKDSDPMLYTAIRQEAFYREEKIEDTTTFRPSKIADVIDAVLYGWNARMYLSKGYYHVEQVGNYRNNTILREIIDNTGGSVSRTGETHQVDIDQSSLYTTHGGYREWAKPLKKVIRTHKHDGSNNILPPSGTYSTPVAFPNTGLPLITNTANENKTLRVRFAVKMRLTNNTGADFYKPFIGMKLDLKLDTGSGTISRIYKPTMYNQVTWNGAGTTNSRYGFAAQFGVVADGEQQESVVYVEFDTPTFTNDGYDTNTFGLAWGDNNSSPTPAQTIAGLFYNSPTVAGLSYVADVSQIAWADDPFDVAYAGDVVLQYRVLGAQVILNQNASNERTYEAENSSLDNSNEYEYPVAIPFGDVVQTPVEPGAFRVWNGSAWVSNQNGWGVDTLAGDEMFHDVAVQEWLALRYRPQDRQYFDLYGVYDACNTASYGGSRYAFIGGEFIARADRWTGYWQRVGRDNTGISGNYDDLIGQDLPLSLATNDLPLAVSAAQQLDSSQVGVTSQPIDAGATVTSIPITAPNHTGIRAGMTITVKDVISGVSIDFEVTADVGAADTSITVTSQDVIGGLPSGSIITIPQSNYVNEIGQIYAGGFTGIEGWTPSLETASPNNTVNASRLLASGGTTNQDAVIQPKGTGAILAQMPDGTVTGGDKRGARAVDLQMSRIFSTDVASGTSSVVGGGTRNKASDNYAVVAGGYGNHATGQASNVSGGLGHEASGDYSAVTSGYDNAASGLGSVVAGGTGNLSSGNYSAVIAGYYNDATGRSSVAMGQFANADKHAQIAFGGFSFANGPHDNNVKLQPLGRITTDDTPTVLTADGLSPSSSNTITIASGEVCTFMIMVQGVDTSTRDLISEHYIGWAQNIGGTTTGDVLSVGPTKNDIGGTAAIAITANDTDDRLDIEVTGVAATTIRWNAYVQLLKIAT